MLSNPSPNTLSAHATLLIMEGGRAQRWHGGRADWANALLYLACREAVAAEVLRICCECAASRRLLRAVQLSRSCLFGPGSVWSTESKARGLIGCLRA